MIRLLKTELVWLLLILTVGFALRLYKIDNPIADWHSWRQADTAAVARNFFKEGFNPFIPTDDDMSPVSERFLPNPNRLRMVEFPIYNSLVYFLYRVNGGVDERLARLVSIFMSMGSTVFLYLIIKREWGKFTAFFAGLFFAILPYNIYYSRVILPEPTLICLSLAAIYFSWRFIEEHSTGLFLLSLFFASSALLVKPTAIFLFLPLIYLFFRAERKIWPLSLRYVLLLILVFLPLIAWRIWISNFPQGIPSSTWLLNGNGIRFKGAFWRWIIQDRFGREILTVAGTVLFTIGLLIKPKIRESSFLQFLALSSFLYLIVFATGNVEHDYYQILIIPALVAFLARGFVLMVEGVPSFLPRIWTIPTAFFLIFLALGLGWYEVRGLYQINNPAIVEAGKEADKILPQDALVIAPYGGDTAFLYQTNRHGFPLVINSVESMIKKDRVGYYLSVNFDPKTKWLMDRYEVLERQSNFVILDLTHPNPKFKSDRVAEPA